MILLVERGVKFRKTGNAWGFDDGDANLIAIHDILDWLGFETWNDYLDALPIERENIFKRAKD